MGNPKNFDRAYDTATNSFRHSRSKKAKSDRVKAKSDVIKAKSSDTKAKTTYMTI